MYLRVKKHINLYGTKEVKEILKNQRILDVFTKMRQN